MDMIKTEHIINACKSSDDRYTNEYPVGSYLSSGTSRETFLTAHDGTPVVASWWIDEGAWDVWYDGRSQ